MKDNYPQIRFEEGVVYVPYDLTIPQTLINEWNKRGYTVQLEIV
jgi:hypothetical protein